jgi:hypothetical protein
MGLEDDAGGASTTVTKFEMLTFPKRPKASDCITNLIPTVVRTISMVTQIRSLEIKVDDADRNVLKEKMAYTYRESFAGW